MKPRRPRRPRTAREHGVADARAVLGDGRVRAFLRRCHDFRDDLGACEMVSREVGRGRRLDAIFYTGENDGYHLDVRARDGFFEVTFGCVAGRLAGDGGTWSVEFGPDDAIRRIELHRCWRS